MHRFIYGEDRMQQALLPHSLEDYVGEENPVRVTEVFIDELDLAALRFSGMTPTATGRPAYHPSTLLKIYLYGYLNRVVSPPSSANPFSHGLGGFLPFPISLAGDPHARQAGSPNEALAPPRRGDIYPSA